MLPQDERPYSFCPLCGGDLDLRTVKSTEPERLVCRSCGFIFYQDPKVAVGTIIRNEHDLIVMVRRAIEPGYGKWVFPGGFVDRGETVQAAAVREAREEAGVQIRIDHLLNVYSYPGRAPVIIIYVATMTGGTLECDDEGLEVRLVAPEDIPWGELAFQSTHDALKEFLDGETRRV
ncbi:MAG TPA: NUDIX hydrolase [Vicinamibacterales bacterium]|nr:NUDIX hydrolase [Vicinamibacterales bacterium]